MQIELEIEKLGFIKNCRTINGFKPHYFKGDDVLFLIGSDYWLNKICKISKAYRDYKGRVFGVLTDNCPSCAAYDWITADKLTLLGVNPTSIGRWRADGQDYEFVEYDLTTEQIG